jgi:hypothetical protein
MRELLPHPKHVPRAAEAPGSPTDQAEAFVVSTRTNPTSMWAAARAAERSPWSLRPSQAGGHPAVPHSGPEPRVPGRSIVKTAPAPSVLVALIVPP